MTVPEIITNSESVWSLTTDSFYQAWRSRKIANMAQVADPANRVEICDLGNPSEFEREELIRRCRVSNAVFYASNARPGDAKAVGDQLRGLANALGLEIAEKHRSAGESGIVALRQSDDQTQRGYIPYTKRPMNWHTDGYYNAPDQKIRAMVLHCVCPAADGGENQFLDPEIAYIRLRDKNPGYIDALMHPHAMTIPENREPNGKVRPASIGPVFSFSSETEHLEMRYTARTRSIKWRDDPMTVKAVDYLSFLLSSDEPFIQTARMQAGEGILCNNSLHNRTGFDPSLGVDSDRLIYRVRFHNRVTGS